MAGSKIEVGQKAPAFALKNQDDKTVKLSDDGLKGRWVVLYFYPKDDTPGCTIEACDFTSGLKSFEKLDAVVLGCSPDSTETHRKFIAKYKLKIQLLSDPSHETLERYGAWGEKNMYGKKVTGVLRSTVLIDEQGRIAHMFRKVKTDTHSRDVIAVLDKMG